MLGWNPKVGLASFSRESKEAGYFRDTQKRPLLAQSGQCQGKQIFEKCTKAARRRLWVGCSHLHSTG